ncbi:hypothetical protein Q8A73_018084 [Channa argus]|nr:hypothetical protein Q8A73_018084 [Channa argus]
MDRKDAQPCNGNELPRGRPRSKTPRTSMLFSVRLETSLKQKDEAFLTGRFTYTHFENQIEWRLSPTVSSPYGTSVCAEDQSFSVCMESHAGHLSLSNELHRLLSTDFPHKIANVQKTEDGIKRRPVFDEKTDGLVSALKTPRKQNSTQQKTIQREPEGDRRWVDDEREQTKTKVEETASLQAVLTFPPFCSEQLDVENKSQWVTSLEKMDERPCALMALELKHQWPLRGNVSDHFGTGSCARGSLVGVWPSQRHVTMEQLG